MRVISGKYKGRVLFSPKDLSVRPTTDRIKENVFNILQFKVPSCRFLDLFSGSGAMAIEALSRGAKRVVAVDCSKESNALIKRNFASVGASAEAEIMLCDYETALKSLCGAGFDIVFCDPPYAAGLYEKMLDMLAQNGVVSEDGTVVVEHALDVQIASGDVWTVSDSRKYGKIAVTFFRRKANN